MRKRLFILILLVVLLVGRTHAGIGGVDNLDVKLSCPSSASVGQEITLSVNLKNDGDETLQISKSAAAGILPNLEISGPVVIPFNTTIGPRSSFSDSDYAKFKIPSVSISNTVIGISVFFCEVDFNNCAVDTCAIEIVQ